MHVLAGPELSKPQAYSPYVEDLKNENRPRKARTDGPVKCRERLGGVLKWYALPRGFPPYKTVYDWFAKWTKSGLWGRILKRLNESGYASVCGSRAGVQRRHHRESVGHSTSCVAFAYSTT